MKKFVLGIGIYCCFAVDQYHLVTSYLKSYPDIEVLIEYFCALRYTFASGKNGPDRNVVRVLILGHSKYAVDNPDWFSPPEKSPCLRDGFTCKAFPSNLRIVKHKTDLKNCHLPSSTWVNLFKAFAIWDKDGVS